nr:unnamed protein product [Spirometra erinaceieuropaei]
MMVRDTDNGAISEAFSVTNLMFYAMLTDAYYDERPEIRIVYRYGGPLCGSRRMQAPPRLRDFIHDLLFADDWALNATIEGDMQRSMDLLAAGHPVDSNGIHPRPSMLAAICDFPPPSSKRPLQQFLDMVNFYQQFRPNCANSILPFTSLLSGPKRSFRLSADALAAFDEVKAALADATLLTHFSPNVPVSLMVDASNVSVGAISQQHLAGHTQPLAFFSGKLPADETWTLPSSESQAPVLRFQTPSDRLNLQKSRQLDYISQFTSNIRHIDGSRNEVTDALSRPSIAHFQLSPRIDLVEMAAEQRHISSPCDKHVPGLKFQDLPLTTDNGTIRRDVPTASHRPFVPASLRRKVLSSLHNLSHPGSRATDKLVSDRFVWPGMRKDLKAWTRACLGCHRSSARIHIKACHPAANGMVERFNRHLKTSLRAADDSDNRTDHLPWFCWAFSPLLSRTSTPPPLDWCSALPSSFLVR